MKTARSLAWITMWGYDGGKRPAFDIVLAGNGERKLADSRVYRSNKATGLCKDQPSEARLEPRGWSEIKFDN